MSVAVSSHQKTIPHTLYLGKLPLRTFLKQSSILERKDDQLPLLLSNRAVSNEVSKLQPAGIKISICHTDDLHACVDTSTKAERLSLVQVKLDGDRNMCRYSAPCDAKALILILRSALEGAPKRVTQCRLERSGSPRLQSEMIGAGWEVHFGDH